MSKLFVVSLLFVCQSVWAQKDCNSGGLRKFDSNIAKLITIGNSGRSFPENSGPELKKYCNHSMNIVNEIESYKTRCMSDAAKQSAGVLIYAVKNVLKQICKKGSPRLDKIMSATPCANLGNAEIGKCYTELIDSFLGIKNEPNFKKRIPFLCCEYQKLFPCIETRLKRVSKCKETHITDINDFIKGITGNMIDLFCGDYNDGSNKCVQLGSPPKKTVKQRRTKSFALAMMDVLRDFPEA